MVSEQGEGDGAPLSPAPVPTLALLASGRAGQALIASLSAASVQLPPVVVGIRVKLVALMVGMMFLVVGIVASYFPAQQIAEMRETLRQRTEMYGRLAGNQLRPAIAFGDQETAHEVLQAFAKDPLVLGTTIFRDNGSRLASEGQLSELANASRNNFGELRTFYLPHRLLVVAPVRTLEGPKGTFVLELSTGNAIAARNHLIRAALAVGAGALALGALLAWAIARSLASRVEAIARAASAVAQGDLEQRLTLAGPRDEIGVLAFGFEAMVAQIRELIQHVQDSAQQENQRLEALVRERTRELDRRHGDLRLVLDNVEQGFITVDREGVVVGERSRIIETWLGRLSEGERFAQRLEDVSPDCRARYDLAWDQLLEGVMPAEVSLAQLPDQLRVEGRYLRFEYRPLAVSGAFEKLLIVISDVTAVVERKRSERQLSDILEVSARLLNDRSGFLEFVEDTRALLKRITRNKSDLASLKRDLHTLKGNAALYGMSLVSELCHEAESQLDTSPDGSVDCSAILAQWRDTRAQVEHLLGEASESTVNVDERDYLALLAAIRTGASAQVLARMVEAWRLEPIRLRLERAAQQLQVLATNLGKGPVHVAVDAERMYLAREELAEFWSAFAHVIRNAAVHGLETVEQRAARGKLGTASFTLRAYIEADQVCVQLEDPGPGVNWDALRALAQARNLAAASEEDLLNVLFSDGVSTLAEANQSAGRGVGLAAVRAACERRRGSVQVTSRPGEGCTFRFRWPLTTLKSLIRFDQGVFT